MRRILILIGLILSLKSFSQDILNPYIVHTSYDYQYQNNLYQHNFALYSLDFQNGGGGY